MLRVTFQNEVVIFNQTIVLEGFLCFIQLFTATNYVVLKPN